MWKPTADTPIKKVDGGIEIISGPGGSPWVTDPTRPHLGGNFDGGDLGTWYKEDLWPWLIETFKPTTMADIGCGTGETLKWFLDHGLIGFGVDGLPWNVQKCAERGSPAILHDFCDGPWIAPLVPPIDLIWCADVAEHIAEEFSDNLINTLKQCHVLAMCQGTEANADDGWHHVNNQPEQYWVDKLAAAGMVEDVALTAQSRVIGNHGWWQFAGRIYKKVA